MGTWSGCMAGRGAPGLWTGLIFGLAVAATLLTWRLWRIALRLGKTKRDVEISMLVARRNALRPGNKPAVENSTLVALAQARPSVRCCRFAAVQSNA